VDDATWSSRHFCLLTPRMVPGEYTRRCSANGRTERASAIRLESILQSSDDRNDKYPTISAIYFVVRERIFCDNQGNGAST
jgi:hypothetical protein